MDATPNWSNDYKKLQVLLEIGFGIHGFHPKSGHCLIAGNYGFTRVTDGKFSFVSYKNPPMTFDSAELAALWCRAEKVKFIDPYDAYTLGDED